MPTDPSLPVEQVKPHAPDCALMQEVHVYEDLGRPSFDWPQPAIECTCQAASPSDPPVGKDSSFEELLESLDRLREIARFNDRNDIHDIVPKIESLFAKQREEIERLKKIFSNADEEFASENEHNFRLLLPKTIARAVALERQRETTLTLFPTSQQFLGGCNCAFKAPTPPTYRDQMEHLAGCPAKGSGYPVGAILAHPTPASPSASQTPANTPRGMSDKTQ